MNATDKVRVNLSEITFAELADALDLVGVADLAAATAGEQTRANAAFAYVYLRRDNPSITYDDVLAMPVASIEIVQADAAGKTPGDAPNGAPPPPSDANGASPRT